MLKVSKSDGEDLWMACIDCRKAAWIGDNGTFALYDNYVSDSCSAFLKHHIGHNLKVLYSKDAIGFDIEE